MLVVLDVEECGGVLSTTERDGSVFSTRNSWIGLCKTRFGTSQTINSSDI
jgi:hypothetical protein